MHFEVGNTLTIYDTVYLGLLNVIKFLDRNFLFIEKIQAF